MNLWRVAQRNERVVLDALDRPRRERRGKPYLAEQPKPRGAPEHSAAMHIVYGAHGPGGLAQEERVVHGVGSLARRRRQGPLQVARPTSALVLAATVLGSLLERLGCRIWHH